MQADYSSLMPIANRPDIVFESGNGSWLTDTQGNNYLDFIQGWAVNTLGHCPPVMVETLTKQAAKLINSSPAFYNPNMLECADLLTANSVFDQVFFTNSGAEANEGAIKLARKWGQARKSGAWKIITFENGFHGRTLTTMAASGKAAFDKLFEPKTPGFVRVPYNDAKAVADAIDQDTVAIMLEPVQGEAGVIPAQDDFVKELRRLADEHQLLLIFDEVQTGVGRTGELFAYTHYGIEPDIMTLGKGLGGGVPIAAQLAKKHCSVFEFGDQGGTYNGNPLMTAVASTILREVLQPGFLEQVRATSLYLQKKLSELSEQFGLGKVRGKGLILALDTAEVDATQVAAAALQQNLLINAPRANTLRFVPALNVTEAEIDEMIVRLAKVL
ncbi:MAG: acetylornithine transaminase [Thiolinea sp.]